MTWDYRAEEGWEQAERDKEAYFHQGDGSDRRDACRGCGGSGGEEEAVEPFNFVTCNRCNGSGWEP